MIIAISPSKSYQTELQAPLKPQKPLFQGEADRLRGILSKWPRDEMKSRMKLSETLADQVEELYHAKGAKKCTTAFTYYTGLVYKQLCLGEYGDKEWAYVRDHLRILSAMYGVLRPQDKVSPYRLDFLVKVPGERLYEGWKKQLEGFWQDEILVDLSSNEFGKLLPADRIQILFLQKNKKGEWKSQSTMTKIARGRMLNWIIQKQIKMPQEIQAFDLDSYGFDLERSTDRIWVFLKLS